MKRTSIVVAGILIFAAGLIICWLYGIKINENGVYAQFAYMEVFHPELTPGINYSYSQGFLYGWLYAPAFFLFGKTLSAFFAANMLMALIAFTLFILLAARNTNANGVLLFSLTLLFSFSDYYYIFDNYWALMYLWTSILAALLFFIEDERRRYPILLIVAWFGTFLHAAILALALVTSLYALITWKGWKNRGIALALTLAGIACFSLYPLLCYQVSLGDWTKYNVLLSGGLMLLQKLHLCPTDWLLKLNPTATSSDLGVYNDAGRTALLWFSPSYWFTDYFWWQFSHIPLYGVAIGALIITIVQRRLNLSVLKRTVKDHRNLFIFTIPICAGIAYSITSSWQPPMLFAYQLLPFAYILAVFVSDVSSSWSANRKRLFWAVTIVFVIAHTVVFKENVQELTATRLGPSVGAIQRVANYVDENSADGDSIFAGYIGIAMETRRPSMTEFVGGNQSGRLRIYDGDNAGKQIIFYSAMLERRPAVVIMSDHHWRPITNKIIAADPRFPELQALYDRFQQTYTLGKSFEIPVKMGRSKLAHADVYLRNPSSISADSSSISLAPSSQPHADTLSQ